MAYCTIFYGLILLIVLTGIYYFFFYCTDYSLLALRLQESPIFDYKLEKCYSVSWMYFSLQTFFHFESSSI